MGIGLCERCIKKYYPRVKWDRGQFLGSWTCEKCGHWPCRGFTGSGDLDEFEDNYRYNVQWLPKNRAKMSRKRKGIRRKT
jgi:hypothetical protein